MEMVLWQVEYIRPPAVKRYCKKCGGNASFISSGKFRINAQAKMLDAWLLYHCACCESTWKLPIISRAAVGTLPGLLLEQLHANDPGLAMAYAMDTALLRGHGCEPGLPQYRVTGGEVDLLAPTVLQIASPFASEVKVCHVLREAGPVAKRTGSADRFRRDPTHRRTPS